MPSQKTDIATIANEKRLIKDIVGLSGTGKILLNDRGWDSRVYSFDGGRYFFKFPRSEKIQNLYKYEIAALKHIADSGTDVMTPKILWEHPDNTYFGYEGVQGSPVNKIIETLNTIQKQLIGKTLGDFLKRFHELRLPDARRVTTEDESKQIQRWYRASRAKIGQCFTDSEQRRLHQLVYEAWPTKLLELGSEPALSHGDLHFENILCDQDGSVGIIDFGDVAYYDRSKDFLELEDDEAVFAAALKAYDHPGSHFMEKIAVRQAMIQIINLGFHAGKEDEENIEKTIDKIKRNLY